MNNYIFTVAIIVFAVIISSFRLTRIEGYEVPYPEGFRTWAHVKTAVIGPNNPSFKFVGGFHHIYANEKAVEGYTTGIFPDGSIIVFDVIEALEENSDIKEGNRKVVDVMIKDSERYKSTGGWGYEEFRGESRTERNTNETIRTQCNTCHAKQKDHVFSELRK